MSVINRYNLIWRNQDDLQIEFECIKRGGRWKMQNGQEYGEGISKHYRNAQSLMWPDDDFHRWTDLILDRIVHNEILVLMGSSDSSKTYSVAKFLLTDWWAFPDITLWLISSTELRGAELRIWGSIKQLFNRARQRYPWLAGEVLDSKHCITTEEMGDDGSEARLLTKGLIFIPCKQGGQWIGMGAYAGVKPVRFGKQEGRLGHVGDECSFMSPSFLDAYSNWYGKANFRGILTGNPCDLDDPLCTAGEPEGGWDTWIDTEKTQEWKSKFYGAHVVALDGRDSPNNDFDSPDGKPKFPYMVGRKKIDAVVATHGVDSWQFYNQCVGKPRALGNVKRVITKQLCENHMAFESVVWGSKETTKVGFMDAAYGGVGGDRCVAGYLEFGIDVENKNVIAAHPLVLVPVSIKNPEDPEVQIAQFIKQYCFGLDIPASNFFFDGRGTLAVQMARIFGTDINVVDFGGTATNRPVSQEEFIWDGDTNTRRLKLCNEHYSKFVSELWFSVYYLIVGHQLRQLPRDVAAEGWKREWDNTTGNRIEVETKKEMKERTNQSPDLFDAFVCGVEGARRLGFVIENMRDKQLESDQLAEDWLEKELNKQRKQQQKRELNYRT